MAALKFWVATTPLILVAPVGGGVRELWGLPPPQYFSVPERNTSKCFEGTGRFAKNPRTAETEAAAAEVQPIGSFNLYDNYAYVIAIKNCISINIALR